MNAHCPLCGTRVALLLPPSRGHIQHATKTHRCTTAIGEQAVSIFHLSRHQDGGSTTLAITTDIKE